MKKEKLDEIPENSANREKLDFEIEEIEKEPELEVATKPATTPVVSDAAIKGNETNYVTPAGETTRMYLTRLGIILSNISIASAVISVLILLAGILQILFYLVLILIAMVTLFTVFLNPEYRKMFSGQNQLTDFITSAMQVLPFTAGASLICAIASIVLLVFDKHERHTGRIIWSGIVIGLLVIVIIAALLSIAKEGQQA